MILFICFPLLQLNMKAEILSNNDEVTLTVCSDGVTKEEAIKLALRNAIEQAYGAFISSNTTILNDEIVKDEIVTITSGNIKSYEEISYEKMPNGKIFVVLKATVSLSKLANYAISKGERIEFNGASFAMNYKLLELNKENEIKVLNNLLPQLKVLFYNAFDYKLKVGNPKKSYKSDNFELDIQVIVNYNENLKTAFDLINSTFSSLYMSNKELNEYKSMNENYYFFLAELNKSNPYRSFSVYAGGEDKSLRLLLKNSYIRNDINAWNSEVISLFWKGINNFICKTNIGNFALSIVPIDYNYNNTMHNILAVRKIDTDALATQNINSGYYRGLRLWIKKNLKLNKQITLTPSQINNLNQLEIVKIR